MRFIVCVISAGEYSCLKVDLLFKREFSYYLIQIYIPCCMLVIVSWVSFWLDANAVPARVSLGVTTLLTMATQTTGINNSLPPVSYTKVSANSAADGPAPMRTNQTPAHRQMAPHLNGQTQGTCLSGWHLLWQRRVNSQWTKGQWQSTHELTWSIGFTVTINEGRLTRKDSRAI